RNPGYRTPYLISLPSSLASPSFFIFPLHHSSLFSSSSTHCSSPSSLLSLLLPERLSLPAAVDPNLEEEGWSSDEEDEDDGILPPPLPPLLQLEAMADEGLIHIMRSGSSGGS
ncbi:hypothetical protein PENTCL1PPCAC_15461, partial [Pristionchus entomophagus]